MFAFLKLIPLKDWIYAGAIALLLTLFGVYTHHERTVGAARILAADSLALTKAMAAARTETDRLQKKADTAEHVHDKEIADLQHYRDTHPVHVGVCRPASDNLSSLPHSRPGDGSDAGASPASGNVLPVPAGNSDGTDIGPLLDILAGKADSVSSQLREYQTR